jgi:hypothetical protein
MISRVHGEVREKDGRYFFAMYHPAAALHQDRLRQTLLEDARTLGAFLSRTRVQESKGAKPRGGGEGEGEPPEQLSLL